MSTIAQKMEVLAGYDRWREDVGTAPVDLSIEGYRKHLIAGAYRDTLERVAAALDRVERISDLDLLSEISNIVQGYR